MADKNYTIPEEPQYSEEIRELQDSDPASASQTFNPLFSRIIENIAALKRRGDTRIGSQPPDAETAAQQGQHYYDSNTQKEYVCRGQDDEGGYVWELVGATDAVDLTFNGEPLADLLGALEAAKPTEGSGPPNAETAARPGQHYYDSDGQKEYVCRGQDDEGGYVWELAGATDAAELTYNGLPLDEALEGMCNEVSSAKTAADTAKSAAEAAQTTADAALPQNGGAMTGTLADAAAAQVRNIVLTPIDQTVGADSEYPNGTCIFVYEE